VEFFNYSGCTIKDTETLIVCGGTTHNLERVTNQCFEFNFRTNKIIPLPNMREIRYTFPILFYENRIYVFGGKTYGSDNK
jgi:hypothetical protein